MFSSGDKKRIGGDTDKQRNIWIVGLMSDVEKLNLEKDKYKFLYEYSRAGFEDELQRFINIENKTAKFLSFLSIIIVSYTLMLRFYSDLIFPIESFLQWIAIVSILVTYIGLISSWSGLFRSLVLLKMPRLPLERSTVEFIEANDLDTVYYHLSLASVNAFEEAKKGNAIKSKLLKVGSNDIAFSMWALCISALTIFLVKMFQ